MTQQFLAIMLLEEKMKTCSAYHLVSLFIDMCFFPGIFLCVFCKFVCSVLFGGLSGTIGLASLFIDSYRFPSMLQCVFLEGKGRARGNSARALHAHTCQIMELH